MRLILSVMDGTILNVDKLFLTFFWKLDLNALFNKQKISRLKFLFGITKISHLIALRDISEQGQIDHRSSAIAKCSVVSDRVSVSVSDTYLIIKKLSFQQINK